MLHANCDIKLILKSHKLIAICNSVASEGIQSDTQHYGKITKVSSNFLIWERGKNLNYSPLCLTYNISDNSTWFLLWSVDCEPIKLYYAVLGTSIYMELQKRFRIKECKQTCKSKRERTVGHRETKHVQQQFLVICWSYRVCKREHPATHLTWVCVCLWVTLKAVGSKIRH